MTEKNEKLGKLAIMYGNSLLIFFLKGLFLGIFVLFVFGEWI